MSHTVLNTVGRNQITMQRAAVALYPAIISFCDDERRAAPHVLHIDGLVSTKTLVSFKNQRQTDRCGNIHSERQRNSFSVGCYH